MPASEGVPARREADAIGYSPIARLFHWLTVGAIVIQVTTAKLMTDRYEANIVDATTNTLYSSHKLIGFLVLIMIVARLGYRLTHGAPPAEPSLSPFQRIASNTVHWALYALLLLVPLGGWMAVSLHGAREVFDIVALPQITPVNQDLGGKMFEIHKIGGFAIVALASVHVAAALYHVMMGDGVMRRMLSGATLRSSGDKD
jgi:cytochrome b561